MLHRPPEKPRPKFGERISPAARRKARYRDRVRRGAMVVTIEIDAGVIGWLCRYGWLDQVHLVHQRDEIARAIERLLQDSARG
jgi:hypothetical protein